MTPMETAIAVVHSTLDPNTLMSATACLSLVSGMAQVIEDAVLAERKSWMESALKRSGDVQAAILAEREACAVMAKGVQSEYISAASDAREAGNRRATAEYTAGVTACGKIADAIRARKP